MMEALYRHMEWADATVWRAILATPAAEGDETLRTLVHHIHMVQYSFYRVWIGEPQNDPDVASFADLASMARWGREFHTLAAAYRATLPDESRIVVLPWAKWIEQAIGKPPQETTLGETMVQVTSHSTYHRGQVNTRIRQLGGEPPLVDFIAWLWLGKPAPEWPQADA